MIGVVFYSTISDARRALLNRPENGWSTFDWSCAYMAVTADFPGNAPGPKAVEAALDHQLYEPAAWLDATHAEEVWRKLQNIERGWAEAGEAVPLTTFPRSMMIGDLVAWESGAVEIAARCGFEPMPEAIGRRLTALMPGGAPWAA